MKARFERRSLPYGEGGAADGAIERGDPCGIVAAIFKAL